MNYLAQGDIPEARLLAHRADVTNNFIVGQLRLSPFETLVQCVEIDWSLLGDNHHIFNAYATEVSTIQPGFDS